MTTINTPSVAERIANRLIDGEFGGTESIIPGVATPTSGYAVALKGHEGVHHLYVDGQQRADSYYELTESYANRKRDLLVQPGHFLGAWLDGDRFVLDVVRVIPDLETAVVTAVQNTQDAIYNLGTDEEIQTKPGRESLLTDEQTTTWAIIRNLGDPIEDFDQHVESAFEVVGAATYDADSDTLTTSDVTGTLAYASGQSDSKPADWDRSQAKHRFEAFQDDVKITIAGQVFDLLDGNEWNGDTIAYIGELFTDRGIVFTAP